MTKTFQQRKFSAHRLVGEFYQAFEEEIKAILKHYPDTKIKKDTKRKLQTHIPHKYPQ